MQSGFVDTLPENSMFILHEKERGECNKWYLNGCVYQSEAFYKRANRRKQQLKNKQPPLLNDILYGHIAKHLLKKKWGA